MSVGFGLLKQILSEEIYPSQFVELSISGDKFIGNERIVFDFMLNHFGLYNEYPQQITIQRELDQDSCFAGFPDESVEYWTNEVIQRWKFQQTRTLISRLENLIENENTDTLSEVINTTQHTLQECGNIGRIKDISEVQREVLVNHNRVQQLDVPLGVPFGLPFLDGVSGGTQVGDVVIVAGKPAVGKSQLTVKFGRAGYEAGYNILAICTEMPEKQVARRDLAMLSNINPNELKMGRLSEFAKTRIVGLVDAEDTAHQDNFYKLLPGGIYGKVEDIQLAVKELKPDLVIIDGASIIRMDSFKGSRWEKNIEVLEALKHLAMKQETRLILTYHFGKGGEGSMDGIYGGQAMSQFASVIISFELEREEDRNNPSPIQYRILNLIKGRDGESGKLRVLFDMNRSTLEQDEVIEGTDFSNMEEEEEQNEEDDFRLYEEI
jgi:replicative DNA helicase